MGLGLGRYLASEMLTAGIDSVCGGDEDKGGNALLSPSSSDQVLSLRKATASHFLSAFRVLLPGGPPQCAASV